MPPPKRRGRVVAFQADAELAALLARLPNRSAYLRRVLLAAVGCECPLCRGTGVVPVRLGELFRARVGAAGGDQPTGSESNPSDPSPPSSP